MENDRRWKTSNDYEESNHGNHSKHGFSIQLLQQQLSCSKVMRCEGTSSLTFHTRKQLPLGNLNEAVWIRSTTAALQNHWIPWVYHSLPVQRATIWTICLCGDVLYQPTMSYKHCEVLPSTDRISSGHLVTVGDGGVWPQEKKKQLLRPNLPQHCNNWVWLKLAVPNGPTRLQTGCVQN